MLAGFSGSREFRDIGLGFVHKFARLRSGLANNFARIRTEDLGLAINLKINVFRSSLHLLRFIPRAKSH